MISAPRRDGSSHHSLRAVGYGISLCGIALCAIAGSAQAQVRDVLGPSADGAVHYSVQVVSKRYGNAQQTRVIRSGQVDDFTWKSVPPGGAAPTPDGCSYPADLPLDANHAMVRQVQVRLAPVVDKPGTASMQLSFLAHTPQGVTLVNQARGKPLKCPKDLTHSQVVRFTMSLNGAPKILTLDDGTRVTIVGKPMR
jgi:hypothetical protein